MEIVLLRNFEHPLMHERVFMPGESDVPDLARLLCRGKCFERSAGSKEAIRIVEPDVLVILNEIDMIRLEALQRLIDLLRRCFFGTPIELRHEERFLPVTVPQSLTHAHFAFPVRIVPAVIKEGDAAVERGSYDTNRLILAGSRQM